MIFPSPLATHSFEYVHRLLGPIVSPLIEYATTVQCSMFKLLHVCTRFFCYRNVDTVYYLLSISVAEIQIGPH